MPRIWNIALNNRALQKKLSTALNISPFLAQLLINRHIYDIKEAKDFLNPSLSSLSSPFLLTDMEAACQRIKKALTHKEKVMIFGDYDVDGISSVAILKSVLDSLGFSTHYYLPHRINEGYGLNSNVLKIAKQNNIKLLITVDCGISNFSEVEELKREGIDVIITDHHLPVDSRTPAALAIINPRQTKKDTPYKNLAGVGVAYKFACALLEKELEEYLDLVCLGTVADSVPLLGENRIIVKKGLEKLINTCRPGLKALIEIGGLKKDYFSTCDIAYILAPRINASGRIDTAYRALKLFLASSKEEAEELAKELNHLNYLRQRIEEDILEEARIMIERDINFKENKVIVLAKDGWHEGVLGIIASRIKNMLNRPTVMISLKEKEGRGSARSIENFHIMEAFLECRDILKNFGGHPLAAGFSILRENLERFKERLNRLAEEKLTPQDIQPSLNIDMQIGLKDLSPQLLEEIKLLEPFGEGNPPTLFYTPSLSLRAEPVVLNKDTLKLWVTDGNFTYPAIGFNMGHLKDYLNKVEFFDLVYCLQDSKGNNFEKFVLKIEDIRLGPFVS